MAELMPCPFCGSNDIIGETCWSWRGADRYWQECIDCGAAGPKTHAYETSIAAWNRRTPEPVTGATDPDGQWVAERLPGKPTVIRFRYEEPEPTVTPKPKAEASNG